MTTEDDDIEYVKRRIDELSKIRKMRPWNKQPFTTELLDFVGDLPSDKNISRENWLRNRIIEIQNYFGRATFRLVYGHSQTPLDIEAKDILDDLLRDDKINQREWDRAVWQRILRRADDEMLESVGPQPNAFRIAKIGFFFLIVVGSMVVVKLIENPFYLPTAIPRAIAGGLAAGLIGTTLYNFSWGHRDLAKRIKHFSPHRNIRLNIDGSEYWAK